MEVKRCYIIEIIRLQFSPLLLHSWTPVRSFSNEFLINFVDFKISKWIMEINEKPTFRVRLVCSKQLASLQLISSDSDLFFHRILHNPIIVLENTM